MVLELQPAIDGLYNKVHAGGKTSTLRLRVLADYCVQRLSDFGLKNAQTERGIPGYLRVKQWDVAWGYRGNYRLGISLKSLLKNLGTISNHIDDLSGEVSHVQQYSPEIVTGYVIIFDVSIDTRSKIHNCMWSEHFENILRKSACRGRPNWTPGLIEDFAFIRVDFSEGPKLLTDPCFLDSFLERMVATVHDRNPWVSAA